MIVHIPILIIAKLLNMWFWDTFGLVAWNLSVTELYSLFSSNISLPSFESQLYGKNLSNPHGHLFWPVCLIYEWYSFKSYVSKILIKEQVNNVIFCVETLIILLTKVLYIQQIGLSLYIKGCECGKEVSLSLFNCTFFSFIFYPHFNIHVHIICHNHIPVVTKYIIIHTKERKPSTTRLLLYTIKGSHQTHTCSPTHTHT